MRYEHKAAAKPSTLGTHGYPRTYPKTLTPAGEGGDYLSSLANNVEYSSICTSVATAGRGRRGDELGGGEIVETSGDCHTTRFLDGFRCHFPTLPLQRENHK